MYGTLDLLEREEELSALTAVLERARGGDGEVVAVEGPGGIGKTRLLAAARGIAREAGLADAARPFDGDRLAVPVTGLREHRGECRELLFALE